MEPKPHTLKTHVQSQAWLVVESSSGHALNPRRKWMLTTPKLIKRV